MINNSLFSNNSNEWETPQKLFDELNKIYCFDIDGCASMRNHKLDYYYTQNDSILNHSLYGSKVFCNPPYEQKIQDLIVKKLSKEENCFSLLLIPARTDTKRFHDYIYKKENCKIEFLKGRLAFEINGKPILDKKGKIQKAPFPSMIVIFDNRI